MKNKSDKALLLGRKMGKSTVSVTFCWFLWWELRAERVRREDYYFGNYTFYINDLPKINVLHKKSEI